MAQNILGGKSGRNFARGEPPPLHSYEYAGVAIPTRLTGKPATSPRGPSSARAPGGGAGKPVEVVVATMRETVVFEKKARKWPWVLGVVGAFFVGVKAGRG